MSEQQSVVEQFAAQMQREGATMVAIFVSAPDGMGRLVYAPTRDDISALLLVLSQTANELVKVAQDAGQLDAMAKAALQLCPALTAENTKELLAEYERTPNAIWPAAHE
ncbi:MAG: hypothetical protein ACYDDD_09635 [Acidithiobacillus ferrivorans]